MWDAACTEVGLKQKQMPRDVSTCWNSAFDMVDFRVLYDQVIKLVMDKRKLGLGDFAIDEHEWELLRQLHNVLKVRTESYIMFYSLYNLPLQVLKEATLFFSRSMPSLAMVIPAMDYIDEVFTTGMLQWNTLNPAIHAAVGLTKKTLNKYYECTDTSKLYHIAMGKSEQI